VKAYRGFESLSVRHQPPIVLYRAMMPPITADGRDVTK
jgi:hypothetical protein